MIEQFRRFMTTAAGKVVATVLSLALLALAIYVVKQFMAGDTPEDAYSSTYICSETGKAFKHRNQMGESTPILSPFSNKNTGYPAEACTWTKDGHVKTDPTWVLLNSEVGKPGPTFCPDCGRLVVGHNPPAADGVRPPPTREEWFARHQPQ